MFDKYLCLDRAQCLGIALLFVTATAFSGCGSKSSLAQVHGKVELDGKPLASGTVLTAPIGGRGAKAIIHNGEFALSTFGNGDGALIGTHQVAVMAYENPLAKGPEASMGKALVPQRYINPSTSELTIEVKAGEVNTPTLKLTSP